MYTLLILLGLSVVAKAQQENQFTQFQHYKLGFNPAYAGNAEGISIAALVRQQWLGIKGAPQVQLVSLNMPVLNNRVGIGANFARASIGVTNQYTAELAYAYRIPAPRGHLNLGLMTSIRNFQMNFSELEGSQPIANDGAIPAGLQSKYVPNFGAGIYYNAQNFYIGLSSPRLLNVNIDLSDGSGTISRETPHFFLMTGVLIPLGDNLKLQPQTLLKYVKGAPFDADANISLIFNERVTMGVSYRLGGSRATGLGEAVSGLFSVQMGKNLLIGMSYDATLSELRKFNNGSAEVVLRYFINGRSSGDVIYDNPRFFF
nr:type IX secretion system membrane protein PorP/SprF [Haliscomenobacter sp.]